MGRFLGINSLDFWDDTPFQKGIPKGIRKTTNLLGFVCVFLGDLFFGFDPMGFMAIKQTTIWENMLSELFLSIEEAQMQVII